jgi:hypothetical protein
MGITKFLKPIPQGQEPFWNRIAATSKRKTEEKLMSSKNGGPVLSKLSTDTVVDRASRKRPFVSDGRL